MALPTHEAGILEYPPKFEEEIWIWLREQYASFILYSIEELLPTLINTNRYKEKNRVTLRELESKVRALKPGESYIFLIEGAFPRRVGVHFNDKEPYPYQTGWGEPHIAFAWDRQLFDVEGAIKKARSLAMESAGRVDDRKEQKDSLMIDQQDLRRECLKYTSTSRKPKRVKRRFRADLTGWKYLKDFPDWKETVSHRLDIDVIFSPETHSGYSGMWTESLSQLKVDAPSRIPRKVPDFQRALSSIREILQHELRHVAQSLLSEMSGVDNTGNPSPSTRVLSPTKGRRPDHALRDVEFYTRLGDEVLNFVAYVKEEHPASDWRDVLTAWVGISEPRHLKKIRISEFFRKLKQHQPDKWRKAVTEFTKAVMQELTIPASQRIARRYIQRKVSA